MVINSAKFDFREVVEKYLNSEYSDTVEAVEEAIDEVSKEAVKRLKQISKSTFDGNEYYKGWMRTRENGRYKVMYIIHGKKPTYSLAHLLEHGHALRNGNRYEGIEHIATVEEWAIDEATDRFIKKMERRYR